MDDDAAPRALPAPEEAAGGRDVGGLAAEPAGFVRFEPIRQLRAHEYVAEQIRRHIGLRLVAPGEALPAERELARMFGVGRPTIQHALRLLEAEGLVEARRGRYGGTFVVEPVQDGSALDDLVIRVMRRAGELEELLDLRRIVEPAVAEMAAERRQRRDLQAMGEELRGMSAARTEPEYMRHDTGFHLALARATGNRLLAKVIEDLRLELNDAMTLLPESETWHRRISNEHESLLEAIRDRDRARARSAMEIHVANSEQSLRAILAVLGRRRELGGVRRGRTGGRP
jgi:DNA-binding FadR family transcriptional regulator